MNKEIELPNSLLVKNSILATCKEKGASVTALREQVLEIVLTKLSVIKAYDVLADMQQNSKTPLAPPTAYRALDFWADQGVLHKIAAANGYILCRRVLHDCAESSMCKIESNHQRSVVLVCATCGRVDEQDMADDWDHIVTDLADHGFYLNTGHVVLTGTCQQCHQA